MINKTRMFIGRFIMQLGAAIIGKELQANLKQADVILKQNAAFKEPYYPTDKITKPETKFDNEFLNDLRQNDSRS